ncbi:hypothetical protein TrRE_jg2244 [Triparma retinervis]|uniref:PIPK domain-containing protein n=1 Tax=Triparma retinervis TaxID=2557542 RepID=A0A9W7G3I7_9STRA|nr:hypothetical protein TrRE_jg2244 [Triparma retinervis]
MTSLLVKTKFLHTRNLALSALPLITSDTSSPLLVNVSTALSDLHLPPTLRSNSSEWEVEEVEGEVFRSLRKHWGVKERKHKQRMGGGFRAFKSNSKGAARAGTIFFFSEDGGYLIKTIPNRERDVLVRMLGGYEGYMKGERGSLLTRFLGVYDLKRRERKGKGWWGREERKTVVVMNSIFPVNAKMTERYDLKGSTVGRRSGKGGGGVMKDLDLMEDVERERGRGRRGRGWRGWGIEVGGRRKNRVMRQLRKDVGFLEGEMVMDYSLLVGVKGKEEEEVEEVGGGEGEGEDEGGEELEEIKDLVERRRGRKRRKIWRAGKGVVGVVGKVGKGAGKKIMQAARTVFIGGEDGGASVAVNGGNVSVMGGKRKGEGCIVYLGLIDFLQPWTNRKVMERQLKGMMGYNLQGVSCAHPKFYSERFLAFVDAVIS